MVALVEHDQTETRAEMLHVDEGGVVGRDGDRLDLVVTPADDANPAPQAVGKEPMPLRDQIEGRRHDERVAPHLVDGQQGDLGLPRAGRQHDHAAALCGAPRLQRRGLEGPRVAAHLQTLVQHAVASRVVLVRDPTPHQCPHHLCVGDGRCAEPARTGIPATGVRQPGAFRPGESTHVEGAGDEVQGNGQGSSAIDAYRRLHAACGTQRTPEYRRRPTPRLPTARRPDRFARRCTRVQGVLDGSRRARFGLV